MACASILRVRRWPLLGLLGLGLVFPVAATSAPTTESLSVAATYASGVHAYYAGDYVRSHADLSSVIEAGSGDPRAFYFRGLGLLQQGRTDEAQADFVDGATREAAGQGTWPVSRSLERVQGVHRLELERHRVRARLAALQRRRADEERRYSQIEEAQPDVLRRRRPTRPRTGEADPFEPRKVAPPAELMPPGEPAPVDSRPSATPEPPEPAQPEAPQPEAPAAAEKPMAASDDPFGVNPPEPAAPADEKPAAADDEKPAAAADEKPAAPADDPFGVSP